MGGKKSEDLMAAKNMSQGKKSGGLKGGLKDRFQGKKLWGTKDQRQGQEARGAKDQLRGQEAKEGTQDDQLQDYALAEPGKNLWDLTEIEKPVVTKNSM